MSTTGGEGGPNSAHDHQEDKKPKNQYAHIINLKRKCRLEDENEVFKRSTQLKKLMNAYWDRQSVDMINFIALFDGRRLQSQQSPDEISILAYVLLNYLSQGVGQRRKDRAFGGYEYD
ncbi:hypothetical protein ACFE04_030437 [Oxalis oulophora]